MHYIIFISSTISTNVMYVLVDIKFMIVIIPIGEACNGKLTQKDNKLPSCFFVYVKNYKKSSR